MNHVLVCYATRYGSTREIARIVGEELEASGLTVSVMPVAEVRDPGEYDAIVIGSPLYMGKWLAEAREFVSRFRYPLQGRPVAVFSVGYSLKDRTKEHLRSGEAALADVRLYLAPVNAGFFPGRVDPDQMSVVDRDMVRLGWVTPGDFRDEPLVRSWARDLAAGPFRQG